MKTFSRPRILYVVLTVLFLLLLFLLPFPRANLYLHIQFDDIENAGECLLYYATDDSDAYKSLPCTAFTDNAGIRQIRFCLEPSLAGHITDLRLDLPNTEQLACVRSVSLSSAGVIRREYDPCYFFSDANIRYSHSINDISLVIPRKRAYLSAAADDPYIGLSDTLVSQIQRCYSNYFFSRLLFCLFAAGCLFSARKKFFSAG